MDIIKSIEHEQLKNKIPELKVGNTVRVHVRIKEGNKERIQVFEGIIIKVQGGGVNQTFTVRKISYGVGVEKTFLVHSPLVEKVELVRVGKARRAKLYYLRDRVGKAAKTREQVGARIEDREITIKEDLVEEPAVEEEKEQPASAPKTKTNDELFAEARTLSDYKTLADKGYAKAYYPLANLYYNNNNYAQAKTWANKSVSAGINLSAARKLLQRITELEQADRYAAALIGNDWNTIRQMADSGYKAAYAKLATHYLQANDYDNADKYAQKACAAGTDKDDAKKVMLALKGYGYYDDKKLPEWIK